MDAETKKESFRLSPEQQEEIADILLSARAVSRQMVSQANEQADELLRNAGERADRLVREAEEKAAETLRASEEKAAETLRIAGDQALDTTRAAEEKADAVIHAAEEKTAEMLRASEEQADAVIRGAGEKATGIVRSADEEAAGIIREAGKTAAGAVAELDAAEPKASAMSEEVQDYMVRCVGDCFARLRQQQQETADFLNEQWRAFLGGLSLPDLPTAAAGQANAPDDEVSRQDIEQRVSAIAKELMEIIGK